MVLTEEINQKEVELVKLIKSYEKVLVAFSGGVDSTYLLSVAFEALGENCKAVFARGPVISAREEKEAQNLIQDFSFPVQVIDFNALQLEEFRNNPPDRCYHCKKKLFEAFLKMGLLGHYKVIEGTNASDINEYRPGRMALQELGIHSPLLKVGLTKPEIRLLSQKRNLPTWDKPSMPCLATRVPHGEQITLELLQKIGKAEAVLHANDFPECRVRAHGEIARIEIPLDDFVRIAEVRSTIVAALSDLGFKFITLDLQGLRSGSLNPTQQEELA